MLVLEGTFVFVFVVEQMCPSLISLQLLCKETKSIVGEVKPQELLTRLCSYSTSKVTLVK